MPFHAICFGRQYGSGGHKISAAVAEKLGYAFYDKDLIVLAAKNSGLSEETVKQTEEKPVRGFLLGMMTGSAQSHGTIHGVGTPLSDKTFIAQSNVIKDAAQKSDCVFIGRCADYILKDHPGLISIFLYADSKARAKRISEYEKCSEKAALGMMKKNDRKRASYYSFYTGRKWGVMNNYDMCVNTSALGIEKTVELITDFVLDYIRRSDNAE